ncbi:MAG: tagaturonate reductase [Bacteroidota bacterium]
MKELNRTTAAVSTPFPEKVLQFGGGNFLRAFADWMLDEYNEKANTDLGVLVVSPIGKNNYVKWQEQEGLYHVLTRGFQNGEVVDEKRLIKSISRILHLFNSWEAYLKSAENPEIRFIISNTTEAGIRFSAADKATDTPPKEFPAKLTLWLYHRYQYFQGSSEAGCILIPVELILKNGEALCSCILQNIENWELEEDFKKWILESNIFCNTLVDRIVPGISRDSLPEEMERIGYQDAMMTQGEAFHFWAIEGPEQVQKELPLNEIGLNVIFTNDLTPYRTRKVRILNGAHTSMVPVGYLYGIETVREAVEDEVMGRFVKKAIFDEIIPTLDLSKEELESFANGVLDRFRNPFIKHYLISIALNSVSKFKTRVLPSILEYQKRKEVLPPCLVFSFAALIQFYKGVHDGKEIPLKDDPNAIAFLAGVWSECDGSEEAISALIKKILKWEYAWGQDLSLIHGLQEMLMGYLVRIEQEGIKRGIETFLE